MRPQVQTITPNTTSTTSFATGLTGAGPFTTFSSPITDGYNHVVTLTSTANLSGITMTIAGTNQAGAVVTEDRAGPNNNTVSTTATYKTITSITASGTLGANTMDVGNTSTLSVSNPLPMDFKQNPFNVSFAVVVSGTLTYSVQHTYDNLWDSTITPTWWPHTTVAAQTASKEGSYAYPVTAIRLNITANTSGTATITVLQGSSQ